jgi:hypothetical protein
MAPIKAGGLDTSPSFGTFLKALCPSSLVRSLASQPKTLVKNSAAVCLDFCENWIKVNIEDLAVPDSRQALGLSFLHLEFSYAHGISPMPK